jgi:hypothetical protein
MIEAIDILVRKGGVFRSWRNGAIENSGFQTFGMGCGIFHDDNWYLLNIPESITLSSYTLDVGGYSGNQQITVTAVGGGWSVQSKPEWITITPTSGQANSTTVTLVLAANNGAQRSGSVVFVHSANSHVTATLNISQESLPIYVYADYRWDSQIGIQGSISLSEALPVSISAKLKFQWGGDMYDGGTATIYSGDTIGYGTWFQAPSAADPKDVYTEDGSPTEYNDRPIVYPNF